MLTRFREFISSIGQTKKFNLLVVGFLIGALGLTVAISMRQTSYRQQAAEGGTATLDFSPQAATVPLGSTQSVDVILRAGANNITAVDITLGFNEAIMPINTFTPEPQFNSQLVNTIDHTNANFHYVAVNTNTASTITGDVKIGTLVLEPKSAGDAQLTLLAKQITAAGVDTSVNTESTTGTFTVTAQPTATPTIAPTNTPAPTASPTPLPTNTPIPPTPTSVPTNTPVPATPTGIPLSPTPTIALVIGDANGDGLVNILDYNIWRDEFLGTLTTKRSDFNHDNKIDLLDFNIWRTALGSSNPTSAPSPSTAPGASINVSPTSTHRFGTLTISWSGISNPNQFDFINGGGFPTIYIQNSNGKCAVGNAVANPTLRSSGSCILDLSSLNVGGNYTVKLYSGSPFGQELATANSFTIDAGFKGVFVTSTNYQGNLEGLSGADAKCQARAGTVGLRGTWKAWLSDANTNVAGRFTYIPGTYYFKTLNGTTISSSWSDLTDGSIGTTINITELRTTLDPQLAFNVWTGTLASGLKSTGGSVNCANWSTSDSSDGSGHSNFGVSGNAISTDGKWTDNTTNNCPAWNKLYCFEQ